MKPENLNLSLGTIFSLKHIILKSFHSVPLDLGINRTQERILMMCSHHENPTMQSLSRQGGLEKGSLTTVVDSLEALGLVRRERQEEDRRSFIVRVTPEGRKIAARIDALLASHLDVIISRLPETEQIEFRQSLLTLARIIPHLS